MDILAVIVFAITGTLEAGRKKMDLFGVIVIATISAIGGGTLRDLLLGRVPVYWIHDINYTIATGLTAIITFYIVRLKKISPNAFLIPDAIGLGLFTVLGTAVALKMNVNWFNASLMGIMTGVFGGVIRDVLCNEVPMIFRTEIYATASWIGAILLIFLYKALNFNLDLACIMSISVIIGIRLFAIKRGITLPKFKSSD